MTSSSVNVATMTRVGGLGVELELATASCVVAVPGPTAAVPEPGSEVPGPGATTAVPGPVVEVPVPPAGFLQSDPTISLASSKAVGQKKPWRKALATRDLEAAWWPHSPWWMSLRISMPFSGSTQHWKTPVTLRLTSSQLMIV